MINEKKYEILYLECSRILCSNKKKYDDYVKIFRECNDGLSWVLNNCSPTRNQFGILGIQIYGIIFIIYCI